MNVSIEELRADLKDVNRRINDICKPTKRELINLNGASKQLMLKVLNDLHEDKKRLLNSITTHPDFVK